MQPGLAWGALVGLSPVLAFLGTLVYLDSFKLVRFRMVLGVVIGGAAVAMLAYVVNGALLTLFPMPLVAFTRYVGPLTEEILKAALVIALIRAHRIGFTVDAAICGFAVGAGFAAVENVYYLGQVPDAGLATWIVRGFGTALMHGGATSVFAVLAIAALEHAERGSVRRIAAALALAVGVHAAYNHLLVSPRVATLAIIVALPVLMAVVFRRGDRSIHRWLRAGFDREARLIEALDSGEVDATRVGAFLARLRHRFAPPVVADMLCYVRIHTELALRAKGLLMMRENGFEVALDEATRDKLAELRYLEKAIGKSGVLALRPLLHADRRDLWELYMLRT